MAALSVLALSCNKDAGKVHTPEDSKEILEDTAVDVVESINPQDFTPALNTLSKVSAAVDNADDSEISIWADDILEQIIGAIEQTSSEEKDGVVVSTYEYKVIYSIAPFTGRFTLDTETGTWSREDANDLSFIIPTDEGDVDINLTISDKASIVKLRAYDNYESEWTEEYEGKDENGKPVYTTIEHRDITNGFVHVSVPESLNVTVFLGNDEICGFGLGASLNTPDYFITNDLTNLDAILAATGSFTQGVWVGDYSFEITKLGVDGEEAFFAASYTKKHATIVSTKFSVKGYHINLESGAAGAESIDVDIDLMGKVQMRGSVEFDALMSNPDMFELASEMQDPQLAQCQKTCDFLNSHIDVALYFGNDVKQAELVFYPIAFRDDFSGVSYYEVVPMIDFAKGNGSEGGRFAFDEYFNEEDFDDVIEAWNELLTSLAEVMPAA